MGLQNYLINEAIEFNTVLVIDSDGTKIGVMPLNAALVKASSKKMDLVCLQENANPPVCKIMNYGKFHFEQQKKEKEKKKNQKTIEISEVQITFSTDVHDLETKANTAKRLIKKGNIVRVVMRLRGREITVADRAIEKINNFANLCSEFAKIKKEAFLEGKDVKIMLEKK